MNISRFRSSRVSFCGVYRETRETMTYTRAEILAQIIIRVKLGTASEEERETLGSWLDESEENRQLYKNIIRWKCIGQRLRLEDEINQTTDFKRVHREVSKRLVKRNPEREDMDSCRLGFRGCGGMSAGNFLCLG